MFSPLGDVRVVDFTASLAGPYCTLLLGALGADVVKLEVPGRGDDIRTWGPPFWGGESASYLAANAGKRSLAVDLKAPEGRELVLRLVERADVFVENMRPGVTERLGLDFDALRARNPRIVYCSIGAFGKGGPLAGQPGYDPLMQAAGGIMSVTGEPGRPPVRLGISAVDHGTGLWALIGVLAALRARDAGAAAQLVDTSLYETAINWMSYHLAGYLADGRVPRPLGTALGMIAPYQAFQARDGRWTMVAAGNDRLFAALCRVLGLPELADDPRFLTNPDRCERREELAELIAERFREQDAAVWLERLVAAGVPSAPVQDVSEVAGHEQTAALGILQAIDHPRVPDLRLVAPPLSVGGERVGHRRRPPDLGEHTGEILAELGYSDADVERLREAGVVG